MPLPRYFEKLAHTHWCHFNEPSAFYDTTSRKRLYTLFKNGDENLEISRKYESYLSLKKEKINEWEENWNNVVMTEFDTKEKPDFIKSAENALYEILKNNQNSQEKF